MKNNFNKIILIGDIHGYYLTIKNIANNLNEDNILFIQVGDFGIGFESKNQELYKLRELNKFLKNKNNFLYAIRGNHDDPEYFNGEYEFSNIVLLKDYSVLNINDQNFLFIGGSHSIDRLYRINRFKNDKIVSWWEDECIKKIDFSDINEKIDVIVSHNTPSFSFPTKLDDIVLYYAIKDSSLLNDIKEEREYLFDVYEHFKPKYWYYGHFHKYYNTNNEGCNFVLLNIDQYIEHKNK